MAYGQTSDQRPHSSPSGSMASDSTFSHNDPRSHQYGGYPHDPFGSAAALLGVPHQQPSGLPPMSSHRPERNSSRSLPLVKARSRSDSPTALARPGVTASATLRATKSHDPITAVRFPFKLFFLFRLISAHVLDATCGSAFTFCNA